MAFDGRVQARFCDTHHFLHCPLDFPSVPFGDGAQPIAVDHKLTIELAALHHELAEDPRRWFAAFTMEEHWHPSDAVYHHLQGVFRIWCSDGTYDMLNLGGVSALDDLARQILIYVDVSSDPGGVSWTVSRFYTGSHRAGDALVPSLRRHVARQVNDSWETEPAQRRSRGRVWWYAGGAGGDDAADGSKVHVPGIGWFWM